MTFLRASRMHWLQNMWPHLVETMRRPLCVISEYPSIQIGQLTLPDDLELLWLVGVRSLGLLLSNKLSLVSSSSLLSIQLAVWGVVRGAFLLLLPLMCSSTITTESLCVKSTTTGSRDSHVRSTTSSPLSSSSIGSVSVAIELVVLAPLLLLGDARDLPTSDALRFL